MRGMDLWCGADGYLGQKEWGEALQTHLGVVLVSGNALGKSAFLSQVVIPHWLLTHPDGLVVVTAPSQHLISNVVWKGIRRAFEGYTINGKKHKPIFDVKARISSGLASPATVHIPAPWNSQAIGLSTTSIERLSGMHADTLIVCEESSGLESYTFEALMSLHPSKWFLCGNPITERCEFFKWFRRGEEDAVLELPAEDSFKSIKVPSTASPHAKIKKSPWYMADASFIERFERQYGKDSLEYRVHILAEFPTEDTEVLIQSLWIQRALSDESKKFAEKMRLEGKAGVIKIAADFSRGKCKDKSVILARDNYGILKMYAENYIDIEQAIGKVLAFQREFNVSDENVVYDSGGDVGSDVVAALRNLGKLQAAKPYNGQGTSTRWKDRYTNQRTASARALARRLNPEGHSPWVEKGSPFHIPNDLPHIRDLIEELEELRGGLKDEKRYALELKEDFSKRIKRSPDMLDALSMSFWAEALAVV